MSFSFEQTPIHVWRQTLVEKAKIVGVGIELLPNRPDAPVEDGSTERESTEPSNPDFVGWAFCPCCKSQPTFRLLFPHMRESTTTAGTSPAIATNFTHFGIS
jgi:hypothetical protein